MSAEQQSDPFDGAVSVFALLIVAALGVWFVINFMSDEIRLGWRYIRIAELFIWKGLSYPLHFIGFGPSPESLQEQIDFLWRPPGGNITPEAMAILNNGWGRSWAPFVAAFFLYHAVSTGLRGRRPVESLYDKNNNGLEPLIKRVSKVNKETNRFVDENPCDYPVFYRPYDDNRYVQRVSPWDFARMHVPPGLDTVAGDPHKNIGPIFDPSKPRGQRFNLKAAETVFIWQMGKPTVGQKTRSILSPTERKVYDYVVARIYGKEKAARKVVAKHAFIRTALLELFSMSSATTNDIPWLKYEDRTLWYCLQDANLDVASAECAGPWIHWRCERASGRAIPIPAIEHAISWMADLCDVDDDELKEYLKEDNNLRDDPEYWANQRKAAIQKSDEKAAQARKPADRKKPVVSKRKAKAAGGAG